MVKSSIPEDKMSILPQNNNCIPAGGTHYADDHPTTTLRLYSSLQYPYSMIDTQQPQQQQQQQRQQQQQQQQQQVQTNDNQQQTIPSATNFMPHLLMLQQNHQQRSSGSQSVGSNNAHENALVTTKGYAECSISNNLNSNVQDITGSSLYTINTTNFWETQSLQPLDKTSLCNNLTIKVNNENSHGERGIAGFVSKLYQSLQAPENGQKYAHWCRHKDKDMFVIDCIPRFTDEVLPRLFKHCKFPSFVRQLNIYGFQRDTDARKSKDTKDKETCRWHHPYFRPGRRDLFHLIRRKATQNSRRKRIQQVVEEDPETIVNMDSEDDYSDIGGLQQRRQSSVSSLSNSASQQDTSLPSSSSTALDLHHHPSSQQQPSQSSQHPPQQSFQHYQSQQQQQQQQVLPNAIYQQGTPSGFDLVDPPMHQHHHQQQPPSSLCLETALPLALQHNVVKTEIEPSTISQDAYTADHHLPMQNSGHVNRFFGSDFGNDSSSPATFNDINNEHQLQQQLCQLQTNYKNDRDYYTRQMHLAYTRIQSQRAHIEQLEAIKAQRQYQMQHQQQRQHSGSFIKIEGMAPINRNNVYGPATTTTTGLDGLAKAESGSTCTPPNHLPNQSFYTQSFGGYYSGTSVTNGSPLPLGYGVSGTQEPLSTSTSSSNHTNVLESQQSTR